MKINHVTIDNHKEPGAQWWEGVASKPDEPLIEATIRFTLSHREYHQLLGMDERTHFPRLSRYFTFTDEELVRIAEAQGWKKYPPERPGAEPFWMHADCPAVVFSADGFRQLLS